MPSFPGGHFYFLDELSMPLLWHLQYRRPGKVFSLEEGWTVSNNRVLVPFG